MSIFCSSPSLFASSYLIKGLQPLLYRFSLFLLRSCVAIECAMRFYLCVGCVRHWCLIPLCPISSSVVHLLVVHRLLHMSSFYSDSLIKQRHTPVPTGPPPEHPPTRAPDGGFPSVIVACLMAASQYNCHSSSGPRPPHDITLARTAGAVRVGPNWPGATPTDCVRPPPHEHDVTAHPASMFAVQR